MTTEAPVLDATCGSKMMWFDKENPLALFADQRTESHILCDGRALNINPDIEMDFREMPFEDDTFYLVVFDPPHFDNLGKNSWMSKKYGKLLPSWESDIRLGFEECWRVLKPGGTLIFKWNEHRIKTSKILSLLPEKPLFGHPTGQNGKTIWMTFFKKP